jgi:hypothetical protein
MRERGRAILSYCTHGPTTRSHDRTLLLHVRIAVGVVGKFFGCEALEIGLNNHVGRRYQYAKPTWFIDHHYTRMLSSN